MPDYKIKQGDCLSSIAQRYGLKWEKVWNHPKNSNLKEKRKNPNVLYPGDMLFIPEKEEKQESGATEQKHRFKVKGVPSKLILVLKDEEDKPRANVSYTLEIDGQLFSDKTDGSGKLEHSIPPNAKKGKLTIEGGPEEYSLQLGNIDPITEITGIQARLNNLGFYLGPVDGKMNPDTTEAIKFFQTEHGLKVNGETDQATRDKLLKEHGC